MKSCEILLNFMKSCEILWIYEIQQISVQILLTSGGFQIMQILFRFTTDFICRFQCGLHYGFHCRFHLWVLWISYEIQLIPYERPWESEESHLNQLFLQVISGNPLDFRVWISLWISFVDFMDFIWNPLDSILKDQDKVKNLTSISCSYCFQVDFLWNLPDIRVKSTEFQVNFMKSTGFHGWNLADFTWNPYFARK